MKNVITSMVLHTQRNTLSNNFLRFDLALGIEHRGLFLGVNPGEFSEVNAERLA